MKHGVLLAKEVVLDPSFEGVEYTRIGPTSVTGGRMVIVAEGDTAKKMLGTIENFEALLSPQSYTEDLPMLLDEVYQGEGLS